MSIKSMNLNIRNIEFIDGKKLESLKKERYNNSRGDPLVSYGGVLNTFEAELGNYMPTQLIQQKIKKYTNNQNVYLVEVNNSYKFRPDLISYIFYGNIEYFHIILLLNQFKSLLEFNPENSNNLIYVFKPEIINKILDF